MGQVLHWKIGHVGLTAILERQPQVPMSGFFARSTPEALARHASWLTPHFMTDDFQAKIAIQAFVVESMGRRIVVDTCIGEGKRLPFDLGPSMTDFLADFAAAGFARETIDAVVCTHLHFDHVGWNTMLVDGRWVPTFPNARYLFGRREWEHWNAEAAADAASEAGMVMGDSVRPIVDAGLADLVASDHRLTDEVALEPTPGHTPGHHSVHITSDGFEAIITGDMSHHPVQWAEPSWGIFADVDADAATRTRMAFADRYGDSTVLVVGTHYAAPTSGRIVSDGSGGWRFAASEA